jgi:phage terminase large subunit-like protein
MGVDVTDGKEPPLSRTVQAIVVAVAAIPSADGTIDACRETRTGAIILIDKEAGKTCPSGWARGVVALDR